MEIKQNTLKQPMGQRKKSQRELENTLRWIKMKIQHTKTYGMQWKAVLRRKCIAVNICIKQEERYHIDNLTFHLKGLEKNSKLNPKQEEGRNNKDWSRDSGHGGKEKHDRINEANNWFFENIDKIDQFLTRLTETKNPEMTPIIKIRSGNGDTTTDLTDRKSIIREYYEQLYMNLLDK